MRTITPLFWAFSLLIFASCGSRQTSPKPRGYYRIAIPSEHRYQPLPFANYPYTFDISTIAQVTPNTEQGSEPYWLDLAYPDYSANVYVSYKPVNEREGCAKFIEDAHFLVYRHTIKADGIAESRYQSADQKTFGYLYEIGGDAATSLQFYITDSTKNFLRGSLYFNSHPNYDSLAPVIRYITDDVVHLMQTLEWK
jgi:gliding motility-associated lipoprotein GldD